jgi:lysophospholipase L1-like esterase
MSSPQDLPAPRRRVPWKRILVSVAIALVLAILVIEVASRIADGVVASKKKDPSSGVRRTEYQPTLVDRISYDVLEYGSIKRAAEQTEARNIPHPYLGYALTPGYRSPEGAKQQVSHNALGFRGKETTWEKPAGVFRIVTTGGSSVYGQSESSDAAVWSQRLEEILNASGRGRFEVINVGCNGWSSFEMLINLELRALDFQPDLVIVYEAINDMRCALYTRGGEVTRDNLQWRAQWPVDRPSRIEAFLAHSRTYMLWRRYAIDYVDRRADLGFFAITNYDPSPEAGDMYVWYARELPVPELGFANYRRNLDNIVSVCATHGAKVVFVTQAVARWHLAAAQSGNEQLDAFDRIQNIEREVAAARGVPLFECAREVEAAAEKEIEDRIAQRCAAEPGLDPAAVRAELKKFPGGPRDLIFLSEVHPSDHGSDLIARTIAKSLLESPLLPPR